MQKEEVTNGLKSYSRQPGLKLAIFIKLKYFFEKILTGSYSNMFYRPGPQSHFEFERSLCLDFNNSVCT